MQRIFLKFFESILQKSAIVKNLLNHCNIVYHFQEHNIVEYAYIIVYQGSSQKKVIRQC